MSKIGQIDGLHPNAKKLYAGGDAFLAGFSSFSSQKHIHIKPTLPYMTLKEWRNTPKSPRDQLKGIAPEVQQTYDGYKVHSVESCEKPCPFHSPSDHPLNKARIHIRADKGMLVERICKHGVGHDDPDSVRYMKAHGGGDWLGTHGCDGCCVAPEVQPPHMTAYKYACPNRVHEFRLIDNTETCIHCYPEEQFICKDCGHDESIHPSSGCNEPDGEGFCHCAVYRAIAEVQPTEAKMDKLEQTLASMEGQQMPHLINGENWWPEREVAIRERKAAVEALKKLELTFQQTHICEWPLRESHYMHPIAINDVQALIAEYERGEANE